MMVTLASLRGFTLVTETGICPAFNTSNTEVGLYEIGNPAHNIVPGYETLTKIVRLFGFDPGTFIIGDWIVG